MLDKLCKKNIHDSESPTARNNQLKHNCIAHQTRCNNETSPEHNSRLAHVRITSQHRHESLSDEQRTVL